MVQPTLKLVVFGLLSTFGGVCQVSYQGGIINPAVDIFKHYLNESFQHKYSQSMTEKEYTVLWTIIVNLLYVGVLVGNFFVPTVAERLGRKWGLIVSNIIGIIGTVFTCLWYYTYHYELLITGRFILGFYSGLSCGLLALYLSEISPVEFRGLVGSFQEMMFITIIFFTTVIGLPELLGTNDRFKYLLWLSLAPTIIQTLALFLCPESPKHLLLARGDIVGAERSTIFFHGKQAKLEEIKREIQEEAGSTGADGKIIRKSVLYQIKHSSKAFKLAAFVGATATSAATFTGIISVENYSTLLFEQVGLSSDMSKYMSVVASAFNVSGLIIALFIVEKVSRRKLLLSSLAVCTICNCIYVVLTVISQTDPSISKICGYIVIVSSSIFRVAFSLGAGPIPWFLTTEMVNQDDRSHAQSIAMFMMWATIIVSGFAFFPLLQATGPYSTLIVFVVPSIICFIIMYFLMPETRGRFIKDIVLELQGKKFVMPIGKSKGKWIKPTNMPNLSKSVETVMTTIA